MAGTILKEEYYICPDGKFVVFENVVLEMKFIFVLQDNNVVGPLLQDILVIKYILVEKRKPVVLLCRV